MDASAEWLQTQMEQHGVTRAALVQPSCYGYDASLLADQVAQQPHRYVGLGMIDPRQADVADRLSYWVQEQHLVGMRVLGRWLDAPYFTDLWRRAADLQAALAFLTGPIDLAPLEQAIQRLPATPIIIDHLAHRRLTDRAHCQQLLNLARYPQVYVKVSGLYALSAQPHPHTDAEWLVQAVIAAFGAQRLMWATDFPYIVDTDGYGKCLDYFQHQLPHTTADERAWICGGTANQLWPVPAAA
jgi:predicted TIM-barrel fold metal-dependent hydrolase